jgi:hypothetical protein
VADRELLTSAYTDAVPPTIATEPAGAAAWTALRSGPPLPASSSAAPVVELVSRATSIAAARRSGENCGFETWATCGTWASRSRIAFSDVGASGRDELT